LKRFELRAASHVFKVTQIQNLLMWILIWARLITTPIIIVIFILSVCEEIDPSTSKIWLI